MDDQHKPDPDASRCFNCGITQAKADFTEAASLELRRLRREFPWSCRACSGLERKRPRPNSRGQLAVFDGLHGKTSKRKGKPSNE
jgi:hypothetical protein